MEKRSECRVQKFDEKDLAFAAKALEIDPRLFPQLLQGMNVELEHCDFTEGDAILSARIALAHLKEVNDYYTKLFKAGL